MDVRDARHEMAQRFDVRKSQAAMQPVCGGATLHMRQPLEKARTSPAELTLATTDSSLVLSLHLHSRTAQLLNDAGFLAEEGEEASSQETALPRAAFALALERERADAFVKLFQETFSRLVVQFHCEGVLTRTEVKELPARWVLQSLNELPSTLPESRERVTLLDVGATVRLAPDSALTSSAADFGDNNDSLPQRVAMSSSAADVHGGDRKRPRSPSSATPAEAKQVSLPVGEYAVVQTASMSHGQYWVELRAVSSPNCASASPTFRVDCARAFLCPPVPLHVDALIPCDEACSPRGTSTCLFLSLLLGEQRRRADNKFSDAFRSQSLAGTPAPDIADLTVAMSKAVADVRRDLWQLRQQSHFTSAHDGSGGQETPSADGCLQTLEVWLQAPDTVQLVLLPPSSTSTTEKASFDTIRTVTLLVRTLHKLATDYDAHAQPAPEPGAGVAQWLSAALQSAAASTTADSDDGVAHASPPGAARGGSLLWSGAVPPSRRDGSSLRSTSDTLTLFHVRLFTMLLRYRTLQGDEGYNGGPHAAVPAAILENLRTSFSVTMEAFASPLNHYFPLYGSLFPDTDVFFGSVGSFFDLTITHGHAEVNPPFDTAVLERTQRAILLSLAQSEQTTPALTMSRRPVVVRTGDTPANTMPDRRQESSLRPTPPPPEDASLLFVVVLPSHDLDPWERAGGGSDDGEKPVESMRQGAAPKTRGKVSTDRALRESPYCLAHVLCTAEESAYIDGQQHLLRAPLFCIRTPTRLIVMGNAAARRRFPDVATRLENVRQAWRRMTLDALITPDDG